MVRNDGMDVMEFDGQACSLTQPSPLPRDPVPAMAYVPFQQYDSRNLYSADQALQNGTLFPELHKPFYGQRGEPR